MSASTLNLDLRQQVTATRQAALNLAVLPTDIKNTALNDENASRQQLYLGEQIEELGRDPSLHNTMLSVLICVVFYCWFFVSFLCLFFCVSLSRLEQRDSLRMKSTI